MSENKIKLRPCPFCGKPAGIYHSGYDDERKSPECTDCGCEIGDFLTDGLAAAAWNHRPIEDALLAACEAAEKLIEDIYIGLEDDYVADAAKAQKQLGKAIKLAKGES